MPRHKRTLYDRKTIWERERNKNLNRMIRRWVPKGTDFRALYPSDVQAIEWMLNHRPKNHSDTERQQRSCST